MRYAPTKVFILENGQYIEISYDDYQRLKEENPMRRFWLLGGILMEVSEEDYVKMNREKSREQYLSKLSKQFGEFSYDSLTTDDFDGTLILVDDKSDVCEVVEQRIMLDKLREALELLSEDEKQLIQALFFEELSERECAARKGVSQVAIHRRKQRALAKLRNLLG